jgi:hypothetical protein
MATYLSWYEKNNLRRLVGEEELPEVCAEDLLPQVKEYNFPSGYYPILKESRLKGLTKQPVDFDRYVYLLVFNR